MPAPRETPARSSGRTALTLLLFGAGALLLWWQVRRYNLSTGDLTEAARTVGAWFLVILAVSLGRFALRSLAWARLLDRPVPLRSLVAATISGDALGNVTPLGFVAGEPAKVLYLGRLVEPTRALAALMAETFFYSVSVAVYVVIAAAAMFAFFSIPREAQLAGILALGGMALVLAGAAWLAWQRPTVVSRTLAAIGGARASRWVDRIQAFEHETYGAAGQPRAQLAVVLLAQVGFHALSLFECWLAFYLLTGTTALLPSLVFDGFNRVANIVFKPIPMRFGVEETGTALLATAIGFPAHGGLLLALVRKLRLVVWAAVGLLLWTSRSAVRGRAANATDGRS